METKNTTTNRIDRVRKMVQKKISKVRVGFVINYSHQKWLGGFNIIANLITAINFLPKKNIDDAIIDLMNAFKSKCFKNSMTNPKYFNIKMLEKINLK